MSGLTKILLFCQLFLHIKCYRPVILVHGLFGDNQTWSTTHDYIRKEHPGTNITVVSITGIKSLTTDLWTQVKGVYEEIHPHLVNASDGVILYCFSQGGLVCRGLLELYPDHNVHTFISLSAPLMGQYGLTSYFKKNIPCKYKEDVYKLVYNSLAQKSISIANYWNDPFHQSMYNKECIFLPKINNCSTTELKNCKQNFLKVKQIVLIGGPDDGVITPWQSSQFGFYHVNNDTNVLTMKETEAYSKDLFGLQTKDIQGNITTYTIPGVAHTNWPDNYTVYECCIKQWLT